MTNVVVVTEAAFKDGHSVCIILNPLISGDSSVVKVKVSTHRSNGAWLNVGEITTLSPLPLCSGGKEIAILQKCADGSGDSVWQIPSGNITIGFQNVSIELARVVGEQTTFKPAFDQQICSICLEDLNNHRQRNLPCKHMFHQACLAKWSSTCPMCKAAF
jgi:hypothetical protein